jgi:hypothetical protein
MYGRVDKPYIVASLKADWYENMLKQAGVPDVCFHDLRHTELTLLAVRKASPAMVQAIARQTTPGVGVAHLHACQH